MLDTTEQTPSARGFDLIPGDAHGLALVVADRGFVWVGEVKTDGAWVYIAGARPVRRWGTTQGLGELATEGPRPNTRLDAAADLKVAQRALIAIIPCEVSKWPA